LGEDGAKWNSGDETAFAIEGKTWVNNHAHVLKPFRDTVLDNWLINYLNFQNLELYVTGLTVPKLNQGNMRNIPIPIPPLDEQKRIVSKLDQCFEAIDKARANVEKNLQNAKDLFQSKLNEIFSQKGDGWEEKKLGEISTLMTGGTPSRSKKEYFENGDIKWLVSGDIHFKKILDCKGRITQLGLDNSNAKYLPINSVMIALNGQGKTRGTVAMLKTEATCNQSLVSISPNDENQIKPEYIFTSLDARYKEIREITGDGGNDRRGLNMPLIRQMSIAFPKSISKQEVIIKQIQELRGKTNSLESNYQQELDALDELKNSILQKVFNGEL
jgi:type I restriction enzyme S subunit